MRDIFADLYNKVLSFFNKTDAQTENAKDVACNRLKLVLMQDRTNLTPAIMDRMRKELIDLLSKYLELDRELLDLNFEHEDEQMALMLSIPVIRAKNEDEINEILAKEDEEREKLREILGEDIEDEEEDDEDEEEDDDEISEEESDETLKSKKERKKEKFFKSKKNSSKEEEKTKDTETEQETDSEPAEESENEDNTEDSEENESDESENTVSDETDEVSAE